VSCDNRRFLRVPAGNGNPKGIVRLDGQRTLSCEVLSKSLGGYGLGVPIDSAAAFPPGRILVLEIDDLVVQVKVSQAVLDPDDDRYLIGLERIAELEDKLAQQSQISWLSALWPARHGLGGQSNMLRDLVLATLFCLSLLLFTCLPKFTESKAKKKTRTASSTSTFSFPWSWPAARSYIPKLPTPESIEAGLTIPAGGIGIPAAPGGTSAGTPAGTSAAPAVASGAAPAAPPK
jgi:hypothetical protein